MDNKMYCTLIRQSIYYITISCSFLCLRGKIIMGQLVKSRVTWESDHICVLITRRSQTWKSFYDFLDLCSHLILLNIFDESTWLTCENNLKKKKIPFGSVLEGDIECENAASAGSPGPRNVRTEQTQKSKIVSFLQTFKKSSFAAACVSEA